MTARNRLMISRYPSPPAPGSAGILESAHHLQGTYRNYEAASKIKRGNGPAKGRKLQEIAHIDNAVYLSVEAEIPRCA